MEMEILHNCDKKLCRLECTAGKWIVEKAQTICSYKKKFIDKTLTIVYKKNLKTSI